MSEIDEYYHMKVIELMREAQKRREFILISSVIYGIATGLIIPIVYLFFTYGGRQ